MTDNQPEPATLDPWTAADLRLTDERVAYLAPRLRSLLAEFAHLEASETPDLEPATTVRPWQRSAADAPR